MRTLSLGEKELLIRMSDLGFIVKDLMVTFKISYRTIKRIISDREKISSEFTQHPTHIDRLHPFGSVINDILEGTWRLLRW